MRHLSWFRHPLRVSGLRTCCLILASSVLILPEAWPQSGEWEKKTTLPTPRGALGACVIGQKLYTVGGTTKSPFTDLAANEVYDLNPWEAKLAMPTPRGWLSVAVVNDTIYAIGGGLPSATSKVEAYNPVTNTWTEKKDMLGQRRAAQAGVVNGIIYVIGGNQSEQNCEAYNPVTNGWTRKSDRPESGGDLAVTVYNGLVYTFGGGYTGTAQKNVYAYDPQTDSWTKKADMPTARFGFQAYLVGGKIYAIGGTSMMSDALKTVEEYNPVSDTWKTLENMPVPLAWFGGAVANNKIYVISGSPDGGISGIGDIWEYTPSLSTAVRGEASYELPKHLTLEQNYPNPFNPTTVVRYQLPLAGEVTLAVYDLLGREVAVLVNGRMDAGVHEVTFDGSGLSSGVYICRLSAGDIVQSRRLLLLK
jgi:N-acetylneuraminic acid mutarotase